MVRYTGRAKTQTGMSTNQVGLKMSGCPSRVGRKGTIIRKFNQRVNCMEGLCGGAKLNGKMWRTTYRNKEPFCKKRSTKCAQAAGGVGRINAPYFNRKVRAGESGCTPAAAPAGATGPAAAEVAAWDAVAAAEKVVEDAFQLKEEKKLAYDLTIQHVNNAYDALIANERDGGTEEERVNAEAALVLAHEEQASAKDSWEKAGEIHVAAQSVLFVAQRELEALLAPGIE